MTLFGKATIACSLESFRYMPILRTIRLSRTRQVQTGMSCKSRCHDVGGFDQVSPNDLLASGHPLDRRRLAFDRTPLARVPADARARVIRSRTP